MSWALLISAFSALSTSPPEAVVCLSGSSLRITGWRSVYFFFCVLTCRGSSLIDDSWQCVDGKEVLATYEAAQISSDYSAMLTIRQAGLAVVTEILTTLMLSQMATVLQWRG